MTVGYSPPRFTEQVHISNYETVRSPGHECSIARLESIAPAPQNYQLPPPMPDSPVVLQYRRMHERSINDPEGFWAEIAEQFTWSKKVRSLPTHRRRRYAPRPLPIAPPESCRPCSHAVTSDLHNIWRCMQWDKNHMSYNFDLRKGPIHTHWFKGGMTNLCFNCLDRNINLGRGNHPCFGS